MKISNQSNVVYNAVIPNEGTTRGETASNTVKHYNKWNSASNLRPY